MRKILVILLSFTALDICCQGKSLQALLLKHLEKNGGYDDEYTDMVTRQLAVLQRQLKATYWLVTSEEFLGNP